MPDLAQRLDAEVAGSSELVACHSCTLVGLLGCLQADGVAAFQLPAKASDGAGRRGSRARRPSTLSSASLPPKGSGRRLGRSADTYPPAADPSSSASRRVGRTDPPLALTMYLGIVSRLRSR
jgi:hypothetical protein